MKNSAKFSHSNPSSSFVTHRQCWARGGGGRGECRILIYDCDQESQKGRNFYRKEEEIGSEEKIKGVKKVAVSCGAALCR